MSESQNEQKLGASLSKRRSLIGFGLTQKLEFMRGIGLKKETCSSKKGVSRCKSQLVNE